MNLTARGRGVECGRGAASPGLRLVFSACLEEMTSFIGDGGSASLMAMVSCRQDVNVASGYQILMINGL